MGKGRAVAVGVAVAVVLAVVGGAVLVRTGAVERAWGDCSDAQMRSAEIVADEIRRELPGRTESVDVDGYCWDQPYPSVGTGTSAERAVIVARLKDLWDCRQQPGTSPPAWDCADVDGQDVDLDVGTDGAVVGTVMGAG